MAQETLTVWPLWTLGAHLHWLFSTHLASPDAVTWATPHSVSSPSTECSFTPLAGKTSTDPSSLPLLWSFPWFAHQSKSLPFLWSQSTSHILPFLCSAPVALHCRDLVAFSHSEARVQWLSLHPPAPIFWFGTRKHLVSIWWMTVPSIIGTLICKCFLVYVSALQVIKKRV